jgi:hypothetical protein
MTLRVPSLNFSCPVCGAAPGEKCELNSGQPRYESHAERKWIAQDHNLRPGVTEPPQGWVEDDRIGPADSIKDAPPLAKTA